MSKFSVTHFDDDHMKSTLLSKFLEDFREEFKIFPDAILITQEQADKYFSDASGVYPNYHGVPLEIDKGFDRKKVTLVTINAILKGMHSAQITDISQIYAMLEGMKENFNV